MDIVLRNAYVMYITWWGAIIFGYAMVVVVNVSNDIRFAPLMNLVYKYVHINTKAFIFSPAIK